MDAPVVRTTCPYCGVGCGVLATPDGRGGAGIAGDPEHPANFGRLCSKGSALGETLGLETRLLHPMLRDAGGVLRRTDWDTALDVVADGFARTVAAHGPDAVAFYLSGQLLTEDYYVANKLLKGFVGTANVDTNSRLCMASSVAGHRRAFGSDTVPGSYEDLDGADLLVLVGSNAAWCHPVLYQRMQAARRRGARMVVVDPRGTATGEDVDLVLRLQPGTDAALFAGLLVHLFDHGQADADFLGRHADGHAAALAAARNLAPDVAATARACGLAAPDVAAFFALWADTDRTVTLYSQGVNQSAGGTDKVASILNCHLATGRIGRPGCGPFSLTGQPNAMGGREVGGLANQLAAHMGFSSAEVDRVGRFWGAARMATGEGLKAVDLFDAVADGRVRALWVMGTNPAVSLPKADAVRAAMARLDLLVVSENVLSTDTVASGAHVLLPAAAWGEKDGTVTNSERRISRQRPFLPLPGEVRPDWWAVAGVARRLGHGAAFAYDGPAAIFREHAALSAFENDGTRDFDIGALAGLNANGYDVLQPVQWPAPAGRPAGTARLFGQGGFFTADRRARLLPAAMAAAAVTVDRPLVLNTGRVRDQWHTMMRTGLSPRLGSHRPEPTVEVHPEDAARYGLHDGGLARIASDAGRALLRVVVTAAQRPGQIFAPIHWNDETAAQARVGALVHPLCDPVSGQPDLKATAVSIVPEAIVVSGFVLSRSRLPLPRDLFWAWAATAGGYVARIAGPDAQSVEGGLLAALDGPGEWVRYSDTTRGVARAARIVDGRLAAVVFLAEGRSAPAVDGVMPLWTAEALDPRDRLAVLAGQAATGEAPGETVCACHGVGSRALHRAIAAGCRDVEALGAVTRAGTNCGSCLPELRRMLASPPSEVARSAAGP